MENTQRHRLGEWIHRIRAYHDLLAAEAFFSLLLFTGFAGVLLAGRLYLTQRWELGFLAWNLFLAWIPYGLSFFMLTRFQKYRKPPVWLILPAGVWLLFLPNCPYLITDFVHFRSTEGFYWWYDVFLYFTFAWVGCMLGVVSINSLQRMVASLTNRFVSWLFVIGVISLCGLGVYLGRGPRWNSWDIFSRPHHILNDIFEIIGSPYSNVSAVGISVIVSGIMFAWYLAYVNLRLLPPLKDTVDAPAIRAEQVPCS